MKSIIGLIHEIGNGCQTGSTLLKQGEQTDMKTYKDASPKGDKLDKEITNNKFTGPGKDDGKIDQKVAPPNPEVAHKYVNTPLMRITKTRI